MHRRLVLEHVETSPGDLPVANFIFVTNGLTANFGDTSTDADGITKHFWNFGDGSPIATTFNAIHTYAGAGTYPVSETVADHDLNIATKSKPVTVVPAGGANQLIANTGFETGMAPWVMSSPSLLNYTSPLNHHPAEPSHGGQWNVWLGGQGKINTDTVAQQMTIPANKTSANLTFWLHIDTNEVTQTRKFDKLSVGVYGTGGTLLGTLATFSNLDKAPGYVVHNYDMSPWIGQTVVLKFVSKEDSSLQTSFVLDDVTLLVK